MLAARWPELDGARRGRRRPGGERAVAERTPSILFLDMGIPPGITGLEVARQVRRQVPRRVGPRRTDKYAVGAFEQGAVDYVMKPFSAARLDATIARGRLAGPPANLHGYPEDAGDEVSRNARKTALEIAAAQGDSLRLITVDKILFPRRSQVHAGCNTPTRRRSSAGRSRDTPRRSVRKPSEQVHRSASGQREGDRGRQRRFPPPCHRAPEAAQGIRSPSARATCTFSSRCRLFAIDGCRRRSNNPGVASINRRCASSEGWPQPSRAVAPSKGAEARSRLPRWRPASDYALGERRPPGTSPAAGGAGEGYVEGQNLVWSTATRTTSSTGLPALARELVAERVDLIFAITSGAARAAKEATLTIPIVLYGNFDPIAIGARQEPWRSRAAIRRASSCARDGSVGRQANGALEAGGAGNETDRGLVPGRRGDHGPGRRPEAVKAARDLRFGLVFETVRNRDYDDAFARVSGEPSRFALPHGQHLLRS